MIPFRVIRSGVLLTGLLAALATLAPAASGSFSNTLTAEQKNQAGLDTLTASELGVLDRLVAADIARGRRTPALTDPYSQRYTEAETTEAGLDRLSADQLARLDALIGAAVPSAPAPRLQPRERPRLRDDSILSEKGRLQVHGGFSMTLGWAEGGRNFRETGAWVSYFDPVTGLGVAFSYSRYKGDMFGGYYGPGYYDTPSIYSGPSPYLPAFYGGRLEPAVFSGDGASLRPAVSKGVGRDFRR